MKKLVLVAGVIAALSAMTACSTKTTTDTTSQADSDSIKNAEVKKADSLVGDSGSLTVVDQTVVASNGDSIAGFEVSEVNVQ
ncbi:MAG: hypothetical protein K2M79_06875 [Muribaculaceae bacterium]|nr:hypothetical protein [Muribaculaceae bacterium]